VIADVTREAVLSAIGEFDRCGVGPTLAWHGFGRASAYVLRHDGRAYPSKAVVGLAAGYLRGEPLGPGDFSGGAEHSARRLVHLDFAVERHGERLDLADVAIPRRLSARRTSADLRLYVCWPTSERTIAACREHNFGSLLSPLTARKTKRGGHKLGDLSGHTSPLEGLPWAIDNGAWPCHIAGEAWRDGPFLRLLERAAGLPTPPSFAVIPDIVAGGESSLEFSIRWWTEHRNGIAAASPQWLLAVQDGMEIGQVRRALETNQIGGLFVGGSAGPNTPNWKWKTVHDWAELGLELGVRVHVGRVNGERRAALCRDLGVTSIDGSSVSMYSINGAKMGRSCDGSELLARDDGEIESLARYTIAKRRFEFALGGRE